MSLNQLINLLVSITLIEMMMAIGLSVSRNDLVKVAKNWRLVSGAVVANFVCVPAATVGLLLLLKARPLPSAGFLILAMCPGAPYGPPITALAKGNLATAVGLMAILAASSAILAPIGLSVLLPLIAGDESVTVDSGKLIRVLMITQLAPLGVGIFLRHVGPRFAEKLQSWANRIGVILNIAALGLILATQYSLYSEIPLRGFVGMAALLIICLGVGWQLGGSAVDERKSVALTTSLRNVGLSLVIATGAFPGTAAVTAVLAYGLFEIIGALLLATWWHRNSRAINHSLAT